MSQNVLFQNSRNLTLVGTLWEAHTQSIIIMAHGSPSNRCAYGLFDNIAQVR